MSVKIGSSFSWMGKTWKVYGFSGKRVLVVSGTIKTSIEMGVFPTIFQGQ